MARRHRRTKVRSHVRRTASGGRTVVGAHARNRSGEYHRWRVEDEAFGNGLNYQRVTDAYRLAKSLSMKRNTRIIDRTNGKVVRRFSMGKVV